MKSETYKRIKGFKKRYPLTIAWRIRAHSKIIDKHLHDNEVIKYAFAAQKNDNMLDIITTYAVVLTNERILVATKRLIWGYFFTSITPEMFNDLNVKSGLIWGRVYIDTIKEIVKLSNIDKKALAEIATSFTSQMLRKKRKLYKEK